MKGTLKQTKQGWRVIFEEEKKAFKLHQLDEINLNNVLNNSPEQIKILNGKKVNFAFIMMEDKNKIREEYAIIGPNFDLSDEEYKNIEKMLKPLMR